MRWSLLAATLATTLAACGTTYQVPIGEALPQTAGLAAVSAPRGTQTASDFRRVALRIEPVAEAFCREESGRSAPRSCDFGLMLVDEPRMGPNAFQTRARDGRPVVVMTRQLLAQMSDEDEIAFVLSHEAAHHIADHIPKQAQQQALGALILGGLAAAAGGATGQPASDASIRQAMDMGASFGARAYSQTYELEADTLGAFIAARAGYDPERGARIFSTPVLAGRGDILSTHPGSPQRLATVDRAVAEIRRQQAAGLTPRPEYAERRF